MKKTAKKIYAGILIFAVSFMCLPGFAADPGSSDDSLISMSYVNNVLIPQMKSYVDSSLANKAETEYAPMENTVFEIVNLSANQVIIGDDSCKFILRTGKATAVSTAKGGLADVTAGFDLTTGYDIPMNHLLIVPIGDWRGIKMQTSGIVMVCGKYSVHSV